MEQYLALCKHILQDGVKRDDRTGTGTLGVFGPQMRFDLRDGFPLVTTKKVHFKSIAYELLWFLRGDTNIKFLTDNGVTIWNEWADPDGELGPVYGYQWRSWPDYGGGHIDQIASLVDKIKTDPFSRRLIVSAWNVAQLDLMALSPCHCFFQMYIADGQLSCHLYQRSADVFIGVPFNIASYALLTRMIAHVCRLAPKELIITLGDAHIYTNHFAQVQLQLTREPRPLPSLELSPRVESIFAFTYDDIKLLNYDPHPAIKGEIAV